METKGKEPLQILILMGTAGCGKSSVAEELQKILNCPYLEGDLYHPPQNVQKMESGVPLTDEDRLPWLADIRQKTMEMAEKYQLEENKEDTPSVAIITCSALRKKYRDILSDIPPTLGVVTFVYLKGSKELLSERIAVRKGHFMASSMLQSQLDVLEEPNPLEEQVIVADIRFEPQVVAELIVGEARRRNIIISHRNKL